MMGMLCEAMNHQPPENMVCTVRHEMISDDGNPTWCKLCGTFDVYCFMANGEMTECHPKPESERWWNHRANRNGQAMNEKGQR